MKIEREEIEFIRDNFGNKYVVFGAGLASVRGCSTLEDVYAWLIENDRLTPDPLEEALCAIRNKSSLTKPNPDYNIHNRTVLLEDAVKQLCRLHEDLTKGEKNES